MDQESEKLLEETYELVKENNDMLRKVRGVQKRAFYFTIIRWTVIIGISVGLFYFLQPYIDNFASFMTDLSTTFSRFKSVMPN